MVLQCVEHVKGHQVHTGTKSCVEQVAILSLNLSEMSAHSATFNLLTVKFTNISLIWIFVRSEHFSCMQQDRIIVNLMCKIYW